MSFSWSSTRVLLLLGVVFPPQAVDGILLNEEEAARRALAHIEGHRRATKELFEVCDGDMTKCVNAFSWSDSLSALSSSIHPSLSTECTEDVDFLGEGLKRVAGAFLKKANLTAFDKEVLLPLLDASGKISPGILKGHLTFAGEYNECIGIDAAVDGRSRHIQGAYYRLNFDSSFRRNSDPAACAAGAIAIGLDLCLPASCTKEALQAVLGPPSLTEGNSSSAYSPVCVVLDVHKPKEFPSASFYIVIIPTVAVVLVCVLSGIVDFFFSSLLEDSQMSNTLVWKLFMACSAYRNIASIFDLTGINKPGQIGPVHCIRFFSMCWVVMGHTLSISMLLISNPLDLFEIMPDLSTGFLTNAFFSVDSFFFLSGLLLGFIWFKNYKKNERETTSANAWIMFYVHRILRLSPPYYFASMFAAFVENPRMLGGMPIFMNLYSSVAGVCNTSWWAALLYVSNYVYYDSACFSVGWYLSSEMQMFLFTPILLIALGKKPVLGLLLSALVILLSTAAHFFTIYHFHYGANNMDIGPADPELTHLDDYGLWIYAAPYIRCQIYVMGILVGWLLQQKKAVKINPFVNLVCWLLSFCLMLTVVLGLYSHNNGLYLSVFWRAAYSSLSRPAWGLALAWIIISCYYGYGRPINDFMSWWIWVPLGRLTYCGYLIHVPLITYCYGLTKQPNIYFSNFTEMFVTRILPFIVLTFFFSVFWSAFFEISFGKVEMLLLGGFRAGEERRNPQKKSNLVADSSPTETAWSSVEDNKSTIIKETRHEL